MAWTPSAEAQNALDTMVGCVSAQGSPREDGRPIQLPVPDAVRNFAAFIHALFTRTGAPQTAAGSQHHNHPVTRDLHEEGRAIDFPIPDLSYGAELANYITTNASEWGVQELIFNGKIWICDNPPSRRPEDYHGRNPHTDHVHVALSPAAAYAAQPPGGSGAEHGSTPDASTNTTTPSSGGSSGGGLALAALALAGAWYFARHSGGSK